jgi:hypothetical protein
MTLVKENFARAFQWWLRVLEKCLCGGDGYVKKSNKAHFVITSTVLFSFIFALCP